VFDRDAKFGGDVFGFLKTSGLTPVRTSVRSPWQNGVAERWVGSCRLEMLDHVIPLNEQQLRRLGRDYLTYYHEDRTHIGLAKETPAHTGRVRKTRNEGPTCVDSILDER
jgi:transposase InsO family protein